MPEGATVTVVVDNPDDDYAELTAEEEAELEAAIAKADRDEGVPWEIVRVQLVGSISSLQIASPLASGRPKASIRQ